MELPDDVSELVRALEQRVEFQESAAKRAIREYKKSILGKTGSGGIRRLERQRDVEYAVSRYMRLCRQLDELRGRIMQDTDPLRTGPP